MNLNTRATPCAPCVVRQVERGDAKGQHQGDEPPLFVSTPSPFATSIEISV
jgi:hypothetical protein